MSLTDSLQLHALFLYRASIPSVALSVACLSVVCRLYLKRIHWNVAPLQTKGLLVRLLGMKLLSRNMERHTIRTLIFLYLVVVLALLVLIPRFIGKEKPGYRLPLFPR